MKKIVRNAIAVGLLTSGIIVTIYLSIRFVSEEYTQDSTHYYALFSDATGLVERTYVKMAGIEVGSITSIRLEKGKARVDLKVSNEYKLFKNAILAKRTTSIVTGDFYLNLIPGTPDRKRIPPGGKIEDVREGTEMEAMAERVDGITKDVQSISSSLKDVFGTPEGKERVVSIITELQSIAENINNLLEQNSLLVEQTMRNVEGITHEARPELKEILSNIKSITSDIKNIVKTQEGDVGDTVDELKGSVKTLSSALEKLDNTLGNVEDITEDVKEGKGTLGKLVADEDMAQGVSDAVDGIGGLLGSIGRLKTIVSLRSDYNFLASTFKTYISVYVQPKEDKFYLVELVSDPRGKTEVETLTVESTHPDHPEVWTETRTSRTSAFKWSFMFGRNISFLTFRFGIKESTGGVGVDFHLLKGMLTIETDLFEFGGNTYPRLKIAAALRFLNKIYILGGVDDIINSDRRDYFVGAMLRFNDEDLKAVLTIVPTNLF
ncbi:MAG: MlaD family protein [Pseudomonadota bacterium]